MSTETYPFGLARGHHTGKVKAAGQYLITEGEGEAKQYSGGFQVTAEITVTPADFKGSRWYDEAFKHVSPEEYGPRQETVDGITEGPHPDWATDDGTLILAADGGKKEIGEEVQCNVHLDQAGTVRTIVTLKSITPHKDKRDLKPKAVLSLVFKDLDIFSEGNICWITKGKEELLVLNFLPQP